MTRLAAPGEPTMSCSSPPLPAAATTVVPSRLRASAASASGSSGAAKSVPRDMLTTSRWSAKLPSPLGSAAQSRALDTTLVSPEQPNTRRAYRVAPGATPGPTLRLLNGVLDDHGPV